MITQMISCFGSEVVVLIILNDLIILMMLKLIIKPKILITLQENQRWRLIKSQLKIRSYTILPISELTFTK